MKIHFVFTPNSRGFGTSFESGQPAHRVYLLCILRILRNLCISRFHDKTHETVVTTDFGILRKCPTQMVRVF